MIEYGSGVTATFSAKGAAGELLGRTPCGSPCYLVEIAEAAQSHGLEKMT